MSTLALSPAYWLGRARAAEGAADPSTREGRDLLLLALRYRLIGVCLTAPVLVPQNVLGRVALLADAGHAEPDPEVSATLLGAASALLCQVERPLSEGRLSDLA